MSRRMSRNTLRCVFTTMNIPLEESDGVAKLQCRLRQYVNTLRKGKKVQHRRQARVLHREQDLIEEDAHRAHIKENWPELIGSGLKEKLLNNFIHETSSASLKSFTCASYAASYLQRDCRCSVLSDANLDIFCCHTSASAQMSKVVGAAGSTESRPHRLIY